jgi:hypothetical protein
MVATGRPPSFSLVEAISAVKLMRVILAITVLLTVVFLELALAEPPRPKYTTLVVEFVGEMDRPVPPIVISTSSQEGEWYKQHFSSVVIFPIYVQVMPRSVLSEITELPLLKRALEGAKPSDEKPKSLNNVRFTAGVGHHHVQTMVDSQTSSEILKNILRGLDKYPDLQSELQEIDDHVRPQGARTN